MRILFLTTSYPAYKGHHQSPFIHSLAKTLVKLGNEVRVIAPNYKESITLYEEIDGVKVNRFSGFEELVSGGGIASNVKSSFDIAYNFPRFVFAMKKEAGKFVNDYDVIHAQWILSGLAGVLLKKKKPLILTTRGADMENKGFITNRIIKYVLENCDYITPNNEHQVKPIRELVTKPIETVPNGIDTKLFGTKFNDRKKYRKKLNLPERKTILFVGWLIPRKDPETMIRAFSKLPSLMQLTSKKAPQLVIIGSGILENEMKNLANELNVNDDVIFAGSKSPEEMYNWYGAANMFVLPSLSEGRPNVILEAMASELPIVATNIDGTNEVIRDGKNGLLVPVKDVGALAKAMTKILKSKELTLKLSKAAREDIVNRGYTWESCAKKYIEIYNKAITF